MGRWRSRQNPAALETLLHRNPGTSLRRGQSRPGENRRGEAGVAPDIERQGNEGLFTFGVCKQTGFAWWYVSCFFAFEWMLNVALAMSPAEVTEKLGLHRMRDRSWYVHPR